MHFNKITVTSNTTNFLNSDMKIEVLWNFTPCQLIVSGNLEMHSTSVFRVKLSKTESLHSSETLVTIYQLT